MTDHGPDHSEELHEALAHEVSTPGYVVGVPHNHGTSHPDNPLTAAHPIDFHNFMDDEENPCGGNAWGYGFAIGWQHGPTRKHGDGAPTRNGAFVEEVLMACRTRLEFYQRSRFACAANEAAIDSIDVALLSLATRTAERIERGVEGRNIV